MNCPNCGTKLAKTNWGELFCPNCGIIDTEENEREEGAEKSYIG